MPFDGIVTHHLTKELHTLLSGGRVRKITQPEQDEVRLTIHNHGENHQLLLTCNPNSPRVHMTDYNKPNPLTPPNFCMVLRKHLSNGIIQQVTQHLTDRIVIFDILAKNDYNDLVLKKLIIEIMGRHANILLIDPESETPTIIDAVKKVSLAENRYRQIFPGHPYLAPPLNDRVSFLSVDQEGLKEMLHLEKKSTIIRFFLDYFLGISPRVVEEICYRCGLDSDACVSDLTVKRTDFLVQSFFEVIEEVQGAPYPKVYSHRRQVIDFSTLHLRHLPQEDSKSYDNVNTMLDDYYYLRDKQQRYRSKSHSLSSRLDTLLKKAYRKQQNLFQDLKRTEKAERYRLYGDLITANIHLLKKGMTKAMLPNYYDPEMKEVEVNLKVNETPAQNAQRYYRRYNKAKRAVGLVTEQLEIVKEQIYYLESLSNSVKSSTELEELSEIQDEFRRSEFSRKKDQQDKRDKRPHQSKPMHFISSEGFDIYVGKNNYQNDAISTRMGVDEDCWLHVKDAPGAHVLVVADGKFITEQTLLEAGHLAGYYSPSRQSENIPIDYVEYKHVKKPNKSKPGMVVYTHQNTMYITPSKSIVEGLKQVSET